MNNSIDMSPDGKKQVYLEFIDDETRNNVSRICNYMIARYGFPVGFGRNRITWESNRVVIKVPRNDYGIHDNHQEAVVSKSYFKRAKALRFMPTTDLSVEPQYAKARIFQYMSIPIVIMQRVHPMSYTRLDTIYGGFIPDWIYSVDCMQVGETSKGAIVAYDYAEHDHISMSELSIVDRTDYVSQYS